MTRTFLRCSLRRQQPSLGSRRFDDHCDPSHLPTGSSDQAIVLRSITRRPPAAPWFRSSVGFTVEKNKRTFRGPSSGQLEQRFFGVPARAAKHRDHRGHWALPYGLFPADRGPDHARTNRCSLSRLPSRVSGRSHRRASAKTRLADSPSDTEKGSAAQGDFLGRNMGADLGRNSR